MNNIFFKSVLRANFCRASAQRGLCARQLFHSFVEVSGETVTEDIASFRDDGISGENFLRRKLNNNVLPCKEKFDPVAIGAPKVRKQFKTLSYLHPFITSNDALERLDDSYTNCFYAWKSRVMRAVIPAASSKPPSSANSHTPVMAGVENSVQDVIQVPIDEDVTGKEFIVRHFDLQRTDARNSASPFSISTKYRIRSGPLHGNMRKSFWCP